MAENLKSESANRGLYSANRGENSLIRLAETGI